MPDAEKYARLSEIADQLSEIASEIKSMGGDSEEESAETEMEKPAAAPMGDGGDKKAMMVAMLRKKFNG